MSQQQWNIVEEKKNKYGRQFIKEEEKNKIKIPSGRKK